AWVEAFDCALVARHFTKTSDSQFGEIDLPYETKARIPYQSLRVDEWDRFHGVTEKGLPFVFSRQGQFEFFDQLDDYDDETITIAGRRWEVPPWLDSDSKVDQSGFWSQKYIENETRFDLGKESPVLPEVLPQLKLARSRVLVIGSGPGHDAAFLAKAGHRVTAVDFSSEAIDRAKVRYQGIEDLSFHQGDAFDLPSDWTGQFDLVFEHTCYCAIRPERRNDLVKVWRRVLQPQGHLLGVFFVMEKLSGPPWGGSEWELRARLKSHFKFLYWTRWRHSPEGREGAELAVFARRSSV
ncbi:MAG: methyltransferase domain-containing protein, partial [Bdellovibrionales bacterium]